MKKKGNLKSITSTEEIQNNIENFVRSSDDIGYIISRDYLYSDFKKRAELYHYKNPEAGYIEVLKYAYEETQKTIIRKSAKPVTSNNDKDRVKKISHELKGWIEINLFGIVKVGGSYTINKEKINSD